MPVRRSRPRLVAVASLAAAAALLLAGCSAPRTADQPPWPAPTTLAANAHAAGLRNVWGEKLAEHIHTHVTITDDDVPVVIPGDVGHSDAARFAAQLHTHDSSGIVHVESPTRTTFTLGQFFDEWGVPLGPDRVGGLRGHLTVWVDGRRRSGDPAKIDLRDLEQIDLVVTNGMRAPRRPAAFVWPHQYH